MFTSDLATIVGIDGRLLSLQPIGKANGVTPPVIHGVPLGLLGRVDNHSDFHLEEGDIICIFYTTHDISDFVAYGNKENLGSVSRNSYNSAFALPFTFVKGSESMEIPPDIRTTGNEVKTGDVNHKGNITQKGDVDLIGNTSQKGNVVITGNLNVSGTATLGKGTIDGINFGTHKHSGVQGGSSSTGGPQ